MEIKKYENSLIAFDFNKEMINATDMLKSYPNKRIRDFIKLKSTKEFVQALLIKSERDNLRYHKTELIKKVSGNFSDKRKQGTWMHRIVALKFAAWLNPEFEVFVYETFDNWMQEKLRKQQRELDYFWDKEDQKDLYHG